ncbi:MAG: DUF3798 domain-containing protein [Rectinemataceae bacterium]
MAAIALVVGGASCSKAKGASKAPPRVVVITPSEAVAGPEFRGAEAFVRAHSGKGSKGEASHAVLPDGIMSSAKAGGLEAAVASFIAGAASDPSVEAVVVDPAFTGSAEGFRRAKAARPELFCLAGDSREDVLSIEASADLVVELDRVYRAYLIPWAARKMGAKALVAAYFGGEEAEPRTARERAIMSAACADLGLKYAAMIAPAGAGAAAYTRTMTRTWLRDYGRDTVLYGSDGALAGPLVEGAIADGGIVVDAAGRLTRAAYAAALGMDLSEAKGNARKERALIEGAIAALGGRGRFGLWDADFAEASVEGLAEFALRSAAGEASGAARKSDLKDLVAALDARSPGAAWLAAYDVDPDTGVKSANRVLLRQDVYVLGSGYLQSALQTVPAKYLTIRADGQ